MIYFAQKNTTRTDLSRSSQMQPMLDAGFSIYSSSETGEVTLIATPEDGFLVEPPVFPVSRTVKIRSNAETEKAINILLGIEK